MKKGKYPPMKNDLKKNLIRYYKPYNKSLEKLISLNTDAWEKEGK